MIMLRFKEFEQTLKFKIKLKIVVNSHTDDEYEKSQE
jgi:hypothetical protein